MKLQNLTGKTFDVLNPTSAMIDGDEICTVLPRLARFGGHTHGGLYSVAQHSLLVESLVHNPRLKLAALLHDAHEVYSGYGDVQSPVKGVLIKHVEKAIDAAIAELGGFEQDLFYCDEILFADQVALATERRDLLSPVTDWSIWPPLPMPMVARIVIKNMDEVEALFRERLDELWQGE